MTQVNDQRLTKYLRKIERKAGQINRVYRERGINAIFDLLEEMEEERYKSQIRINDLRFSQEVACPVKPNGSPSASTGSQS